MKPNRKRVGYTSEGSAIIRDGATILNDKNEVVGQVTSGCYGPSFKKGVGMAYIN